MRVLLSTIGSRGDVQPLVALASRLRALGQEVRLCVPPDFCEWIQALGFAVTPIGPVLRTFPAAAAGVKTVPLSAERRRELIEGTVAAQFDTIDDAAEGCDVIVAATALQIAARSVAERMGIGYVFAAYAPVVLPSALHPPPPLPTIGATPAGGIVDNRELWARDAARFNEGFGAALNGRRASLGLPAVSDVRSHIFTARPWLAADPTLAPWPERDDAGVFQCGAWILPDERPLASDVDVFLAAAEPPIYFGFGSMRGVQDVAERVVQAARLLGRRAIVSRGWADLSVTAAGDDCLTIGEANLHALFTRVAAVVHHGGAGTTTLAALAGVPQVIIPQMYDQHYWAQRVHRLGIGVAHAVGPVTAQSLAAAIGTALDGDVAARARSTATAVRTDGAQIAAERLIAGEMR